MHINRTYAMHANQAVSVKTSSLLPDCRVTHRT